MRRAISILIFYCASIPSLANAHEFDSTFDASTNILTIPYLEVPTLGVFDIALSLSDLDNLLFDLVDATEVASQAFNSGSYNLETQSLSLEGLRALGTRFTASFSVVSESPVIFQLTSAAAASEQVQVCAANDAGNGSQIIAGPDGPMGADNDSVFRSLTVSATDADVVFLGTERNGILRSLDGGENWDQFRQGIRFARGSDNYPEIWNMVVHPLNNDVIYAASLDSPGPLTDDFPSAIGGVYKSIDGGENWFRANCGLVNSRATAIALDPAEPNRVLLGIEGGTASFSELQGEFFEGGIYLSSDDGSAWNKLDIHADDVMNGFTQILPYGNNGEFIAFGFYREDTSRNVGFVRLSDSGASTELFAEELRGLIIPWYDVSSDGEVIYAVEQDSFQIRRTTNAGLDWESIQQPVNGPIAVSPVDANEILFAQVSQLRKSSDGGNSADVVLDAGNQIHDIVHAPSNPDIVYVATEGYLVYKSTDNGESFEFLGNLRDSVLNAN